MTCLFPLNSENLSFRDSVACAKPIMGCEKEQMRGEGVVQNANSYAERHRLRSDSFLFEGPSISSALSPAQSRSHLNFSLRKPWFKSTSSPGLFPSRGDKVA